MAACEIVWVRCNEPAGPLLSLVRRTGQRLSIVDKCDTNRQASPTMRARNSTRRLFNGTIVSADPGSADAAHAAAVARRLRVRDMWESGQAITSAPCVHGLTPSPAPSQVQNVGEEGFGYLAWIVERWESLPPCASICPYRIPTRAGS